MFSARASDEITRRELQILELMCDGLSNPDILTRCRISAMTLKSHQRSLYQKFGVGTRSQLIVQALRFRVVCPEWLAAPSIACPLAWRGAWLP